MRFRDWFDMLNTMSDYFKREIYLRKIRDNYPKYILTRNDPLQSRNGILHRNLPEFMRDGESF